MLSFKITKKPTSGIEKDRLPQSSKRAFTDDNDKEDDEPDFIDRLDGTAIVSKKQKTKTVKSELVIPLITKNEWRIDKNADKSLLPSDRKEKESDSDSSLLNNPPPPSGGVEVSNNASDSDLKSLAVKELLEEATNTKSSEKISGGTIPILFQNRLPDGYEEDDNMDVSLRPQQSTLDDYERIPIDEFGLAMLRGMVWKAEEGIGGKNKQVILIVEPKLRPKGMGLGAEAAHLNKDVTPKNSSNSKEENKENLSFKLGGNAVITRGSKKGYYGHIESFDEDNNRVILKLAISRKMEAVSKFYINMVSASEFKKNSKVVNIDKYEEYSAKSKEKEKRRHEGNRSNSSGDDDDTEKEYSVDKSSSKRSMNNSGGRGGGGSNRSEHEHRERRTKKDYERRKYDDDRHNRRQQRRDKERDSDRSEERSYRNSSKNRSKRDHRDNDDSRQEHRDRRGHSSRHSSSDECNF